MKAELEFELLTPVATLTKVNVISKLHTFFIFITLSACSSKRTPPKGTRPDYGSMATSGRTPFPFN